MLFYTILRFFGRVIFGFCKIYTCYTYYQLEGSAEKMPFEPNFTKQEDYARLDQSTLYRFAEIEISQAIRNLMPLYMSRPSARNTVTTILYNALVRGSRQTPTMEEDFFKALNFPSFLSPQRAEKIHYLIMKDISYQKIRTITSASPNTISKMRYGIPTYYPIFQHWNEEMLDTWNTLKGNFNLFNEDLIHMK